MSRFYRLAVNTTKTTSEQLVKVLVDKFNWTENYLAETTFEGEGNLCGGQSEEEAHEEISKAIKKLSPKAKVRTNWTYMEDLPCEEYGDEIDY